MQTQERRTYQAVIGLEFHVHLATRTKMFCGCRVTYGEPPNTHTCPVCLGHPGALPVANEKAIVESNGNVRYKTASPTMTYRIHSPL